MSGHEESICHNVTANPSSTCGHHILLSYGLWIIYQLKITFHWNKIILSTYPTKIILNIEFSVDLNLAKTNEIDNSIFSIQYRNIRSKHNMFKTVSKDLDLELLCNPYSLQTTVWINKFCWWTVRYQQHRIINNSLHPQLQNEFFLFNQSNFTQSSCF